jgi:hypothetical protein
MLASFLPPPVGPTMAAVDLAKAHFKKSIVPALTKLQEAQAKDGT